jgi:hypothetical protein
MAVLVLEQSFATPISSEELNDAAKRVDKCLEAYGARWMRSYLSKDRKRLICEFEAPDAEAVRTAYRNAAVEFDSCWIADMFARDKPSGSY